MNNMQKTIILLILWLGLTLSGQSCLPDLSKPQDLAGLGTGQLIEKDNTILKRITLKEIKDQWIVYLKDQSLHDKHMDYIRRLEFPASKWGRLYIEFVNYKPTVTLITY
jgi:hypothetical protein